MTETKFTKGPWKRKDNFVYSPMFDEDDTLFVSIAVACTGIAPAIANANLIAAAPEMFEALKSASIALDMVRGSTFCETCDDNEICETCGIYKAQLQTDAVLKKARGEE